MKTSLLPLFLLFAIIHPFIALSQLKLVSVGAVYLSMSGGSSSNPLYLVIDEPNDDVFVATTPGRKLISEDQFNIVRWNIRNSTGNFIVPFNESTTSSFEDVGVAMSINSAGDVSGYVDFATYGTGVANLPLPDGVTSIPHVNSNTPADGEWVYDRFWIIDATSYTTLPSGELTLQYASNEMTGNLLHGSSILRAQQYDPATGWGGTVGLLGIDNLTGTVSGISFTPSNLTPFWTLVEENNPLPVELIDFSVNWENDDKRIAEIIWKTASEVNNDYFEILRSHNGTDWEIILKVDGQGTSNNLTNYHEKDRYPLAGISYYRLKQKDFNGEYTYSDIRTLHKGNRDDQVNIYPNPATNHFHLQFTNSKQAPFEVRILDNLGRLVKQMNCSPENSFQSIAVSSFIRGSYIVQIVQGGFQSQHKLIVNP